MCCTHSVCCDPVCAPVCVMGVVGGTRAPASVSRPKLATKLSMGIPGQLLLFRVDKRVQAKDKASTPRVVTPGTWEIFRLPKSLHLVNASKPAGRAGEQ